MLIILKSLSLIVLIVKKNLCFQCESIHKEHKTIEYGLNLRKKKEQLETTNKLIDILSYIKNNLINKFQSFYDWLYKTIL